MEILKNILGQAVVEKPEETVDERLFRAYIRELNTPQILSPEEYVDKYAPNFYREERC